MSEQDYNQSGETTRLAYMEDRIRTADPVTRILISLDEALLNLARAEKTVKEFEQNDATDDHGIAKRALGNRAHAFLMKSHGWVSALQSGLAIKSPDTSVQEWAQQEFGVYSAVLAHLLKADTALIRTQDAQAALSELSLIRPHLEQRQQFWNQVDAVVRPMHEKDTAELATPKP